MTRRSLLFLLLLTLLLPTTLHAQTTTALLPPLTAPYTGTDTGPHVTLLQQYLQAAGTYPTSTPPTGRYDAATTQAVTRFQTAHQIPTTPATAGFAGPTTRAKLNQLYATPATSPAPALTASSSASSLVQTLRTQLLSLLHQLLNLLQTRLAQLTGLPLPDAPAAPVVAPTFTASVARSGGGGSTTVTITSPGGGGGSTGGGTATTSSSYTIIASAGTGGTITPSGTITVNRNTSQTFTVTPASGYQTAQVLVDGLAVSLAQSYLFDTVTANHTIAVTFTPVVTNPPPDTPQPGSIFLTPGSGFSGATSQPPAQGNSNQAGYDAKAIARWDVVPYQTFDTTINVGVVAFHMNGIDRVEFSANGGAWLPVSSMTLNPETNVVEYWVSLRAQDFADGQLEVRAVAYPTVGEARVLESLSLSANANHSLPELVRYVSPTGSDTAGDGSVNNPYQTITGAALAINSQQGNVDGATIYLAAGDYVALSGTQQSLNRWLTITPAPGVSRSSVRLVSRGRPKASLIRFSNLTIVPYTTTILEGYTDAVNRRVWLDSVAVAGSGRMEATVHPFHYYTYYLTDSTWCDTPDGPTSVSFVRGSTICRIKSDSFQNASVVINSTVDDIDRETSSAHPDFYQIYVPDSGTENFLFYGVTATNVKAQGIFIGAIAAGEKVRDMALIDVSLAANGYSSQWSAPAHHVYLRNFSLTGQSWIWKTSNLTNFKIDNSSFGAMKSDGAVISEIQDRVILTNNTFGSGSTIFNDDGGGSSGSTDSSAPSISAGSPSGTLANGTTATTLAVTTNETAACRYAATANTTYSSMTLFDSTNGISHQASLTNLADNNSYTYYVKCQDTLGNTSADYLVSFSVGSGGGGGGSATPSGSTDGLVLYLPFDNSTVDGSGSGNDGIAYGSPSYTTGKFGQALSFNGTSQYVVAPSSLGSSGYPFTFSAWVKGASTGVLTSLVIDSYNGTYYEMGLSGGAAEITARALAGTAAVNVGTTAISSGDWTNIVGVFNSASDRRVYVNGALEISATGSVGLDTRVNSILVSLRRLSSKNGYLAGAIDEVRVYNRALSEGEIAEIYQAGTQANSISTFNLAQLYQVVIRLWQQLLALF